MRPVRFGISSVTPENIVAAVGVDDPTDGPCGI
jgi:hypothetical protein